MRTGSRGAKHSRVLCVCPRLQQVMAPNHSKDFDAEARERELMDGLRLVVTYLAAALLDGPRNEHLVELQAKYVECMNVVKAQQCVLEMQQNEMETLQTRLAELAARLPAVAPPIDTPAQPPTSMVLP